jgi:hypothetical protein
MHRPHPCVTASPLSLEEQRILRGVSKDGGKSVRRVNPSRRLLRKLLKDEVSTPSHLLWSAL